jgi:hypothetical protein
MHCRNTPPRPGYSATEVCVCVCVCARARRRPRQLLARARGMRCAPHSHRLRRPQRLGGGVTRRPVRVVTRTLLARARAARAQRSLGRRRGRCARARARSHRTRRRRWRCHAAAVRPCRRCCHRRRSSCCATGMCCCRGATAGGGGHRGRGRWRGACGERAHRRGLNFRLRGGTEADRARRQPARLARRGSDDVLVRHQGRRRGAGRRGGGQVGNLTREPPSACTRHPARAFAPAAARRQ